jgi:hypothetical protein
MVADQTFREFAFGLSWNGCGTYHSDSVSFNDSLNSCFIGLLVYRRYSHYDRGLLAGLCEQFGLFETAASLYTDSQDISRCKQFATASASMDMDDDSAEGASLVGINSGSVRRSGAGDVDVLSDDRIFQQSGFSDYRSTAPADDTMRCYDSSTGASADEVVSHGGAQFRIGRTTQDVLAGSPDDLLDTTFVSPEDDTEDQCGDEERLRNFFGLSSTHAANFDDVSSDAFADLNGFNVFAEASAPPLADLERRQSYRFNRSDCNNLESGPLMDSCGNTHSVTSTTTGSAPPIPPPRPAWTGGSSTLAAQESHPIIKNRPFSLRRPVSLKQSNSHIHATAVIPFTI